MQDWAALFSQNGDARKYFLDATGGAFWVHKVCDGLVSALLARVKFTVLDERMTDILNAFEADPLFYGMTIWPRFGGGFQVSIQFREKGSWAIKHGDSLVDILSDHYAHEKLMREQCGITPPLRPLV